MHFIVMYTSLGFGILKDNRGFRKLITICYITCRRKGLIGILLSLNYSSTAIILRSAGARFNKISIRLPHKRDLRELDSFPGLPAQKLDGLFYLSSSVSTFLVQHPEGQTDPTPPRCSTAFYPIFFFPPPHSRLRQRAHFTPPRGEF